MRFAHVWSVSAMGAVVIGSLAGCSMQGADADGIDPTPAPTSTSLFASDEEALAAAVEAYEAYGRAADEVARGGWMDLTPLEETVTAEFLVEIEGWAEQLREAGYRREGRIAHDSPVLERVESDAVTFFICVDLSTSTTFDRDGNRVEGSLDVRRPSEITVDFESGQGLVSGQVPWAGSNFCLA